MKKYKLIEYGGSSLIIDAPICFRCHENAHVYLQPLENIDGMTLTGVSSGLGSRYTKTVNIRWQCDACNICFDTPNQSHVITSDPMRFNGLGFFR